MPSVLSKQYSVYDLFIMRVMNKDNFYKTKPCATAERNKNMVYQPIIAFAKQCQTYEQLSEFIQKQRTTFKYKPTTY